jgi:hypothetical protein
MYIICLLKIIWNPCMFIRLNVIFTYGFHNNLLLKLMYKDKKIKQIFFVS